MKQHRRNTIEYLLERGGAIQMESKLRYVLRHPTVTHVLKPEEVTELLDEGSLVLVNCGCTGFWWAMRPDLVAMRSARRYLESVA